MCLAGEPAIHIAERGTKSYSGIDGDECHPERFGGVRIGQGLFTISMHIDIHRYLWVLLLCVKRSFSWSATKPLNPQLFFCLFALLFLPFYSPTPLVLAGERIGWKSCGRPSMSENGRKGKPAMRTLRPFQTNYTNDITRYTVQHFTCARPCPSQCSETPRPRTGPPADTAGATASSACSWSDR